MSEFKVGDKVVLKNSSQDKVMTIQECYKEFIRAYWNDEHYSFAHEVNFRFATPEEIAAGHRIDEVNADKCREDFERLSNIRTFLPSFRFNTNANEYERSEKFTQPEYTLGFFNGAWYAFQEQQAKVEELQKRMDKAIRLLVEAELYQSEPNIDLAVKALKGEG